MIDSAFYESNLLIIEICVLFCLLVNLYNFFRYIFTRPRSFAHTRRVETLKRILSAPSNAAHLTWLLERNTYLQALLEALQQRGEEGVSEEARQLVGRSVNENLFRYSRRDDAVRALAVNIGSLSGLDSTEFRRFLTDCIHRQPVYLRVASLRACAALGSRQFLLEAFKELEGYPQHYGVKLLTDVLLLYRGDFRLLAGAILDEVPSYHPNLICALLSAMIRLGETAFSKRILSLMKDAETDGEIRIAAIKYFGALPYRPAQKQISEFLGHEEWEYAAMAARSLESYSCRSCGDQLLRCLSSRNWYVRYNSAATLASRRPDLVGEALNSSDRYARNIMQYAINVKEAATV
ncbi:MAG: HEAT repeat domain-containing protein [Oscillospiraceae bacterium]|nr:HEAT repeat domain-containing protein [Oscillospiraceae bacterium]